MPISAYKPQVAPVGPSGGGMTSLLSGPVAIPDTRPDTQVLQAASRLGQGLAQFSGVLVDAEVRLKQERDALDVVQHTNDYAALLRQDLMAKRTLKGKDAEGMTQSAAKDAEDARQAIAQTITDPTVRAEFLVRSASESSGYLDDVSRMEAQAHFERIDQVSAAAATTAEQAVRDAARKGDFEAAQAAILKSTDEYNSLHIGQDTTAAVAVQRKKLATAYLYETATSNPDQFAETAERLRGEVDGEDITRAQNVVEAREETRKRDQRIQEEEDRRQRQEQQQKAYFVFAAQIYADDPAKGIPSAQDIADAVDAGMLSGDDGRGLLSLKIAIADRKREDAQRTADRQWTVRARKREEQSWQESEAAKVARTHAEQIASGIFLEINQASSGGNLSSKDEYALRTTVNLALSQGQISFDQARSLQGEVDQAVAGTWSNSDWKDAVSQLRAAVGVKSETAPDYNAEKALIFERQVYRMRGLVRAGVKPMDALARVMPDAVGTRATAETERLVKSFGGQLGPNGQSLAEGWSKASISAIDAQLEKMGRAPIKDPVSRSFRAFLIQLKAAKARAQRLSVGGMP